jgi:hypothetical protein
MHRLPAALVAACLVLAGCSGEIAPPSREPSPSSDATPTPTIPPPRSQEPSPLLSVETVGGECAEGACHRLINVEADGTLREVIPLTRVVGRAPAELLEALQVEMDRADFPLIESRPFTGECPTAFDGQETIYTFHLLAGDEQIRSCKVAIDENHPLFQAVAAILSAGGV